MGEVMGILIVVVVFGWFSAVDASIDPAFCKRGSTLYECRDLAREVRAW